MNWGCENTICAIREMNDKIDVKAWVEVERDGWSALLLGNGASIAIYKGFSYQTLRNVAEEKGLLVAAAPLFAKFKTVDFEHVLLACWYAECVNRVLKASSGDISAAYEEVKEALIAAVHCIHPMYADISADLKRVGKFASAFRTVVSLNYDLIMYWAMMGFNECNGCWFKDAFRHREFVADWEHLRRPHRGAYEATLVFYPHGNISLARDFFGEETKIVNSCCSMSDLLDTITKKWKSGKYSPVFVSEGTSAEKVAAIHRSRYLTNVYEKVLPTVGDSLVVYGWSFDERDQHILDAIARNPLERMAVSVFTGQSEDSQQAFCCHVREVVKQSLPDTKVTFFDSRSPGCWNNS